MSSYEQLQSNLQSTPRTWLVTGCAGFIGSHLTETLLRLGQRVVGLDNFATGSPHNLEAVRAAVGAAAYSRLDFQEGDVADLGACHRACGGVEVVLHQAGFVSVPESVEHPLRCHATNVTGTLNLLVAAHHAKAARFVYASSCAVYGDEPSMPQREDRIGRPLSPYSAAKRMTEIYAGLFAEQHGLHTVGLRYFNVFGPRQSPEGGYAAVIPAWVSRMRSGAECVIHGDGSQTRDFCHVANVVQANLLAATTDHLASTGSVYNVALGGSTNLLDLHRLLAAKVAAETPGLKVPPPRHGPPRAGDIVHSSADIGKIRQELGFAPVVTVEQGIQDL